MMALSLRDPTLPQQPPSSCWESPGEILKPGASEIFPFNIPPLLTREARMCETRRTAVAWEARDFLRPPASEGRILETLTDIKRDNGHLPLIYLTSNSRENSHLKSTPNS